MSRIQVLLFIIFYENYENNSYNIDFYILQNQTSDFY